MPIDTSSYPTPQAAPFNPLTALHSFAQTQNLINQNAQFQQQFAARKAIGPIMQQSIDPSTGQLDYNKAFILMAQDPQTAFIANDFLNGAVTRQFTQAQTAKVQLETAISRNDAVSKAAGSLLALGRSPVMGPNGQPIPGQFAANATPEDLIRVLTSPDMSRIVSPKDAVKMAVQYAQMTPVQRHDMLQQRQTQAMSANEASQAVLGKMVTEDQGGTKTIMQQSPVRGTSTPVKSLEMTPTVAERNAPRKAINPQTGAEEEAPAFKYPMQTGAGRIAVGTGAQPGAQPGTMPPADVSLAPSVPNKDQARVPAGGQTPGSPTTPSAAEQATRPTGLDPNRAKSLEELATKYEPQLNERVNNATTLKSILAEANELRKNFTPGGGAAVRSKLAATLQGLGLPADVVNRVANGNVDSSQAFDKLMTQAATLAMGTLFRGTRWTQQEWQRMQDANPNLNTSPGALTKMFHFIDRMATMTQKEQEAFSQYRSGGHDLLQWESKWNKLASDILSKQRGHI